MDTAERPDHKYTIPTHELPIVLDIGVGTGGATGAMNPSLFSQNYY